MTKLIVSTSEFKQWRHSLTTDSVALVPTMGNLHLGHVSLVREAAQNHDITIVTIFVNPKQFGPNEDFEKYPRTLDEDLVALKDIKGEVVVFAPKDQNEIYPDGFATEISVPSIAKEFCGKSRPTHFAGVTTVVYQLFVLSTPETAYFGLKDYQQFKIIERMTQDLHLPVKLKGMPVVRDHDGLALSSRNRFFTNEQRPLALELPMALDQGVSILKQQGLAACQSFFKETATGLGWDYLEVRHANSLRAAEPSDNVFVLAGAKYVGSTRIIDNRVVELNVR